MSCPCYRRANDDHQYRISCCGQPGPTPYYVPGPQPKTMPGPRCDSFDCFCSIPNWLALPPAPSQQMLGTCCACALPCNAIQPRTANLPVGMQYLYPSKHTYVQVPKPQMKLWEGLHFQFPFEIFKVPCTLMVRELIELLGGDQDKAAIECIEIGGGRWLKASVVKHTDANAAQRIDKSGWTEKRGTEQAPVWLVILPA